ncbi:solute carrier family 22 member 3-like [Cydia pomonella]|uniref:solute carrier family 22 member 3-like n=1 Tax=Cydia pomonella TaxID=82600 RepID=UPI002ADD970E|nr:solute carrier family 22 member 3-like [Cydia pomonella]
MSIFRYIFRTAASNPIEARFNVITRYHCLIYFVVFLSKIPAIWHILNLMILNPPITYTCGGGGGGTDRLRLVSKEECPCTSPTWDRSVFSETVQTKFGLICDRKKEISLSETCAYGGMLVGAFLFGLLSDRFGRLIMFSISFVLTGIAGVAVSQSPNMKAFYAFRFFEGLGAGGTIVTSFVLLIEYTGMKYRETVTAVYHLPVNLSHLLLAGVSYGLRNAFDFQLAVSVPMFLFGFAVFFLNESPLWLLTRKYKSRTVKAMQSIAKFNKKPDTAISGDIDAYYYSTQGAQQEKIQLYHIFKYRRHTLNLFIMAYMYLVCGMGYYGVSQYISKMSGKIHVNIAISAILVMPGTLLSVYLLNKIGRKPFLFSTNLLAGAFMLITVIVPSNCDPTWPRVLFACISNCFFFMSFIVVFLYGVELFPTQIRNSALGVLSVLSRAGMMIAPQINILNPIVAGYVFAVLALLGSLLVICLPETKNKELPSTLKDQERR